MELQYVVADPAGNITGFVLTEVPRKDHKTIANYLIEQSPDGLEQVGFISDCADCDGSLDMMGGEFCGNASRSLGLYLAKNLLSRQTDKVWLRVSGASGRLEVQTDIDKNEAKIKMPRIISGSLIQTADYGEVPVIAFEGIVHVLLIDRQPDKAKGEGLVRTLAQTCAADAIGLMYYESDRHFLTPLVWVRATDTMIWESSCGSGSIALADYLNRAVKDDWTCRFTEPGGSITVEKINDALYLGGQVTFSDTRSIEYPDR